MPNKGLSGAAVIVLLIVMLLPFHFETKVIILGMAIIQELRAKHV